MVERPDQGKIDPETRIGAVRLAVGDLGRMKRFYSEDLGLELLDESNDVAYLGIGDQVLVQLISRPGGEHDGQFAGLFHLAILLPERESLANWLHHFISRGNYLSGVGDHLVSEALYLADPEGNGIEIYRDRPEDQWMYDKGRLRMDTLPIDLDKLLSEASKSDSYSMPEGTSIGHIHLRTSDIVASTRFYRDELGFGLQTTFPSASFLSAGGYHHHIGINAWGDYRRRNPDEKQLGLVDFEIIFPDERALEKVRDQLLGAENITMKENGEIKLIDPVGIGIVLRVEGQFSHQKSR